MKREPPPPWWATPGQSPSDIKCNPYRVTWKDGVQYIIWAPTPEDAAMIGKGERWKPHRKPVEIESITPEPQPNTEREEHTS
jgi:hypothetical protein